MADVFVSYARSDKARVAPLVAAIEAQIKRLSQITDAFAARRMDASIKAALAGRRLNEIEE